MQENQNANQQPMSVKDWLITLLLMSIPLVGFVLLFVYAFGSSENVNKQNWAKAQLIFIAIIIGLMIVFFSIFGAIFASAMAASQSY